MGCCRSDVLRENGMALELTAPDRVLAVRAAALRSDRNDPDLLPVAGVLPPALSGALRGYVPQPGLVVAPNCSPQVPTASFCAGVRLSGGTARWHRAPATRPGLRPTLPATAEARPAGSGVAVARPVPDPSGAELHTVAVHPGLPFAEHLIGTPGRLEQHSEPFPLEGAPLVLALVVTHRWVVVLDLPVTHRESAALVGSAFPWRWTRGHQARIGLLPRSGGCPRWFRVEPCFVFHLAGAYEDGDTVVLDGVRHERAFDPAGPPAGEPLLWRWELDAGTGATRERPLSEVPVELPAMDSRFRSGPRQVVWTVELARDAAVRTAAGPAVLRHRMTGGRADLVARHELGFGRLAGEPVFVPAALGAAEGEGWLLAPVDDDVADRTEILVLDAQALAPLAAVLLPVRLPAGLHGDWLPLRR